MSLEECACRARHQSQDSTCLMETMADTESKVHGLRCETVHMSGYRNMKLAYIFRLVTLGLSIPVVAWEDSRKASQIQ